MWIKKEIFGMKGFEVRLDSLNKYSEICDGCGKRRVCQCFTRDTGDLIIDLCRACQKEYIE